mgnify:FL=1
MLHLWKRGLSAAAALALVLTMALPASAADPLSSGGFAQVLISAEDTDIPDESLQLALYQQSSSGTYQYQSNLDFTTPVNRVTKDVELHLTPQTQQVTLQVDYLTDLDGNGVYELLSGQTAPASDRLAASGALVASTSGVSTALTQGVTYTLTAETLLERGRAAITDRTTNGSASYLSGLTITNTEPESILYMVTVTYHSNSDNADYELCYYLRLYDQLPAPSAADYQDVAADAWYYDAVDYAVSHEYLSGTTRTQFSPEAPLTRAILVQILYQVAGQPESGISHYSDVPDDSWCYAAVSWASSNGILTGSGSTFDPERAPARQELAAALYRFAQYSKLDTSPRADLSSYADADQVASWARAGMEWSVSVGLLAGHSSGDEMLLSPSDTVTRAEFSAVLRTLCESVLPSN